MSCTNCYNGCTEIVSDKCVKYTGVDVPVLGIQTGDSLSLVEQSLITFLTSTLDGTGIKIDLDPEILCAFVSERLPVCGDITLVDVLNALTSAVCFLKDEVTALEVKFSELEQGYVIDCLEGSPDPTSTYEVLQATIEKLCALEDTVIALALDLDTNYVKLADLDTLIQAYLDSIAAGSAIRNRMVPYTVVEYYGTLANFDGSGSGLGDWAQVYLCNGNNGTPDKRGVSPIGAIQGVGGGALSATVDPALPGNTNYALGTTNGVNIVTLTTLQMPSHTHTATSVVSESAHSHFTLNNDELFNGAVIPSATTYAARQLTTSGNNSYTMVGNSTAPTIAKTSSSTTGATVATTNAAQGGGQSHNNVHPVLACYYIMYIPA